uniref:Transposase n=1 Tax=Panagrellus redivivus TaxID=6233 RepID=A0A7E4W230_PANRE
MDAFERLTTKLMEKTIYHRQNGRTPYKESSLLKYKDNQLSWGLLDPWPRSRACLKYSQWPVSEKGTASIPVIINQQSRSCHNCQLKDYWHLEERVSGYNQVYGNLHCHQAAGA